MSKHPHEVQDSKPDSSQIQNVSDDELKAIIEMDKEWLEFVGKEGERTNLQERDLGGKKNQRKES